MADCLDGNSAKTKIIIEKVVEDLRLTGSLLGKAEEATGTLGSAEGE